MTDARSLIMGSGAPGYGWYRYGDTILGQIITEPKAVPQKEFGTDRPALWPSGDPKYQTVFQVKTSFRNYEGIGTPDMSQPDTGTRTMYIKGKHLERAIKDAILAAGAEWLDVGGWLEITYVADDMQSKAPIKPKMFTARYQPPPRQAQQQVMGNQQGYQPQGPSVGAYTADTRQTMAQPYNQPPRPPQQAAQPNWQRAGWNPYEGEAQAQQQAEQRFQPATFAQQAVPSHHGQAEQMPDWARPASAPPAPSSAPPAPQLSTLQMIAASQSDSPGINPQEAGY